MVHHVAFQFSIAEIDTESKLARLRQLAIQGRWLEWTDAMHSDLSWRRLIHGLDDGELRFNLRAISNTLPTPDNLRRWGQNEVDPACPLCGRPATLRHILNSCEKDLLNMSFPVRKAGRSDFKTVHLLIPLFFSVSFFNDFSLTTLRTTYHLPYPGHIVALHV